MDHFYEKRQPFLFIIDFEKKFGYFVLDNFIAESGILFAFHERKNQDKLMNFHFESKPIQQSLYESSFQKVKARIQHGDSYLTNLSFATPITTDLSLDEIYTYSNAKYKLLLPDQFVVFSPERFVYIDDEKISTNPMKGTSSVENDPKGDLLLSSDKEMAEHFTIVDLMRNDLSMVAKNVSVQRFKYLNLVKSNRSAIWQMSSEIQGILRSEFKNKIGSLFDRILPAGSISGAPKKRTCEIISEVENYRRGFYTGVFGCFDGIRLDSAVMIRFIEKQNNVLVFKSGGGITSMSELVQEYDELNQKIYVPIF